MFGEPLREVELARGLIDDTGARHCMALLQPLDGWQEVSLGASVQRPNACRVHTLLAAGIVQLGEYVDVKVEHAAALSRGDRERVAMHLRSMMFGDRLAIALRCPNPVCAELADLDLSVGEILGDVCEPEPEWFEVDTPEGLARFRPPTGVDDEVCETNGGTRAEQETLLWSRLVDCIGDRRLFGPDDWRALQTATRHVIALALADSQNAPELSFVSRCPTCHALMEIDLDPFALLARELRLGADRLLVEAHCLAFHYGWSEDQVFAVPRNRRWRYLELLRNQLEGRALIDPWS